MLDDNERKKEDALTLDALLSMAQRGRIKARDGKMRAPFELMGASVTLALIPQHDMATLFAGSNISSMAGLIDQFSKRLKDKKLSDKNRKELLDEMKQAVENPLRSQEEARGRVLAPYVIDIREPEVSDDDQSCVTLGWIIRLGLILDDYHTDMAGMKVPFDEKLAEQLLIGSRFFHNWTLEKMSDVQGFYDAIREDELGNSGRSQPGSQPTDSQDAASAVTPSSKSPGAATRSSATSTAQSPEKSLTQGESDS